MDVSDFDYHLPEELIAQQPPSERTRSRLLRVYPETGRYDECAFGELDRWLRRGDILVVNDTRVMAARLLATKPTGGRVEVLVERVLDPSTVMAQLGASKPVRPGQVLHFVGGATATVAAREGGFFRLAFDGPEPVAALIERLGRVPLPPYIRRQDDAHDRERYQTVFARRPGAVAAPTAGLHFDEALMERVRRHGVDVGALTLHVGAGTFQPVRVADVRSHRMHAEAVTVPASLCERIERARRGGGRVVAVGTTTVRALETAAAAGALAPFAGDTELFIYPGYRFRVVDLLITNFHLPRSTLLMMVCAFGGRERVLAAYRHAVERRLAFYSYGDAMLLDRAG